MKRFVLFFLASCSFVDEPHYYVDPRLEWVVDSFYQEGVNRGVFVRRYGLVVTIENIDTPGRFEYGRQVSKIIINQVFFEHGYPDSLALQYIVFHEFGHFIGRNHNTKFSIMNPNTYAAQFRNDAVARSKLMDELFLF